MPYQKQISNSNKNKIISLLNQPPYGLTFTELIEKSGLSRAIVNQHLKKLENEGIIKKEYEKGKILNKLLPREKLSSEGKKSTAPVLFSLDALPYILAEQIYLKDLSANAPGLSYFEIKPEKALLKDNVELIGKRLGVFYLFAFMKTLEENNLDWIKEAGGILNIEKNPFVPVAFNLPFAQKEIPGQANTAKERLFPKEGIAKLKNLLNQIYPEEIREFENILKGQKNYEHPLPPES